MGEQLAENEQQTSAAKCSTDKPNSEQSIRVLIRVRPLNKIELNRRGYSCIDVTTDSKYCRVKSPYDSDNVSEFNFYKVSVIIIFLCRLGLSLSELGLSPFNH